MKARIATTILALLAATAQAGVYKIVNPDGSISYSDKPAGSAGARVEPVQIRKAPRPQRRISADHGRRAGDFGDLRPLTGGTDSTGRLIDYWKQRDRQIDQQYEQTVNRIEQEECQYYRDRLNVLEQEWRDKQHSGYSARDQTWYENRLRSRRADVARECR